MASARMRYVSAIHAWHGAWKGPTSGVAASRCAQNQIDVVSVACIADVDQIAADLGSEKITDAWD
jgi:hypothetical protein